MISVVTSSALVSKTILPLLGNKKETPSRKGGGLRGAFLIYLRKELLNCLLFTAINEARSNAIIVLHSVIR